MNKKIAIIYNSKHCYTRKLSHHIQNGITFEAVRSQTYCSQYISEHLCLLDNVDAIIFGTPTYFGNVSTNIKNFMDSTTDIWRHKKWNNKVAAGFTHSSALSGDKLNALMSILIFAQQHGMIWAGVDVKCNETLNKSNVPLNRFGSWIGLMVESEKSNKKTSYSDIKTAEYFGARIAKVTKSFK